MVIVPKDFISEKCDIKKWVQICHRFPAIGYNPEALFLNDFAQLFQIKKPISIKMRFPDWNYLEQACAEQKGWTIMPQRFVKSSSEYHLIDIPGGSKYSFKMLLYFRKEYAKMDWFRNKILLTKK